MRKKFALLLLVMGALLLSSVMAWGNDHCTLKITGLSFSSDGSQLVVHTELINDGDVDLTVTKVTFNSLNVQNNAGGKAGNIYINVKDTAFENMNVFIQAGYYVDYTFRITVTGNFRRYFVGQPAYQYKYYINWNRGQINNNDDYDYDDDEEYDDDDEDYDNDDYEDEDDDSF